MWASLATCTCRSRMRECVLKIIKKNAAPLRHLPALQICARPNIATSHTLRCAQRSAVGIAMLCIGGLLLLAWGPFVFRRAD